ncbi:MAG: putative bifunctional diguanylate cyclase/phosphodiesterase [Gammaproteobacteria bacterium]
MASVGIDWIASYKDGFEGEGRSLFVNAPAPMLCLDEPGRIIMPNNRVATLLGRTLDNLTGRPFLTVTQGSDRRRLISHLARVADGQNCELDLTVKMPRGTEVPVSMISSPVLDRNGQFKYSNNVVLDVSRYRRVEETLSKAKEHLTHIAHHDALTGLPNRYLFEDRLKQAVLRCRRNGWLGALVFIDIDRFKLYNDMHGHEVGDAVLVEAATRLSLNLREQDTVCRYSGDEFILILEDVTSVADVNKIVDKLQNQFSRPIYGLLKRPLALTASFGATIFDKSTQDTDADALVRQADAAMYEAKQTPKAGFELYSPRSDAAASNRRMLVADFESALSQKQLWLAYQPQIDWQTSTLVGVESLIRWDHPKLGLVAPSYFIEIAETTEYSERICRWVLLEACNRLRHWDEEGISVPRIAVNVSPRDVCGAHLIEYVEEALESSGIAPGRLEVEITETSVLHHPPTAERVLGELSEKGVHLALDDFGTGYSSLRYLRDYPFDRIKIDRSFVADLITRPENQVFIDAMVSMASSLGIAVVAEGVESAEQGQRLADAGVDIMQGYYHSRPLTHDKLAPFMNSLPVSSQQKLRAKSAQT